MSRVRVREVKRQAKGLFERANGYLETSFLPGGGTLMPALAMVRYPAAPPPAVTTFTIWIQDIYLLSTK